ncbi:hypothetical protein F5883DRAFT_585265 [Diaporthe sp. PMI_573]|nr:hypothetical protein F5883DRAFT_585265 [Diaporthaceae sp. PMI_573]
MRGARERIMPLLPEPFDVTTPRLYSQAPPSVSIAKTRCKFFPNLDISQYRESLSEGKKTELDQKCNELFRRATENQSDRPSAHYWEVCAWIDVFGLMHDDENIQMDKRPYEFVESTDTINPTVKSRIPDATIGLRTYDSSSLELGSTRVGPECNEDNGAELPDKRLSQMDLKRMMRNSECGLIVDGVWGESALVFPFAVYGAKKKSTSLEAVLDQIHHACRTYLAMLDDLARNPENVAEYQTDESSRHQMFALVSSETFWRVLVAWNQEGAYIFETIWEGYVTQLDRATELIHVVDQIRDYATHDHRHYVMKHLEAWYARHKKTSEPSPAEPTGPSGVGDPASPEERNAIFSGGLVDYSAVVSDKTAAWVMIKEQSKKSKREKRTKNRRYAKTLHNLNTAQVTKRKTKKRGRGRPPLHMRETGRNTANK